MPLSSASEIKWELLREQGAKWLLKPVGLGPVELGTPDLRVP